MGNRLTDGAIAMAAKMDRLENALKHIKAMTKGPLPMTQKQLRDLRLKVFTVAAKALE